MTRLLLLSDLHCTFDAECQNETHLFMDPQHGSAKTNPYCALLELLESEQISGIDAILCCGDISNKVNKAGLESGWTSLNVLRDKIAAGSLYTTTGNHDVDSRYIREPHDPRITLQRLCPKYPVPQGDEWMRYWAQHFYISNLGDIPLASINTCAHHGMGINEIDYGRIDPFTSEEFRAEIDRRYSELDIKSGIAICHHHPHKMSTATDPDTETVIHGDLFLDMLSQLGSWIVFHGHRHKPAIRYASCNGSNGPVVFSLGSFSAKLHPELLATEANQVYVVDVNLNSYGEIRGKFKAWDFVYGTGWRPARATRAIPHSGGFGYRVNIAEDIEKIRNAIGNGSTVHTWNDICLKVPELDYALPVDCENIIRRLKHLYRVDGTNTSDLQIGAVRQ